MASPSEPVLSWYPPFAFSLTAARRYSLARAVQANALVAFVFAGAFLVSSVRERTLIMRGGVGLLQHPGIWVFLVAQVVIPWAVTRSLRAFRQLPSTSSAPLTADFLRDYFHALDAALVHSMRRESSRSRALFDALLLIGLSAWAWNTFQNQDPIHFLRFDFWDSIRHPGGYWLTRFYKLYVWVLIGPAVVHAQLCLVHSVKRLFTLATAHRGIILDPYASSGDGGLAPLIETVINPMVPIVVASSLLTMSAFWVHGKYDVTTIGGLLMTIALLLFIYLLPAIALRRAIREEKARQQNHVCKYQRALYEHLLTTLPHRSNVKDDTSTLSSLADLSKRLDDIPNWPQFIRITRLAIAAGSSPIVAWSVKQLQVIVVHALQLA